MKKKLIVFVIVMVVAAMLLPGCGETAAPIEIPREIGTLAESARELALLYATELSNGGWGNLLVGVMESGLGTGHGDFEGLHGVLIEFKEESETDSVFVLYPDGAGFIIAVDSDEEPDAHGRVYEETAALARAWSGTSTASSYGLEQPRGTFYWTAFAPIRNIDGDVVAVLGIDFPAPRLRNFSEWNRNSSDWNGLEAW